MSEHEEGSERIVRRARLSDVPDLVELRAEMFRAMGTVDVEESAWQASAEDWFRAHLHDERVCIVIVEAGQRAVSTAMAAIRDSVPSPSAPAGGDILISNVCTLPSTRSCGHGRAAFNAVLDWARSTGLARAELMATGDGQAMYERVGFAVTRFPAMRASLSAVNT